MLKILSKNQIMTSIKCHNSAAKLQKMTLYNPNVELVNDNVHTKFDKVLFTKSQAIEQKPNFDVSQGP